MARIRFATAKTLVPVAVAGVILFGSQLVMAAAPTADFDFSPSVGRVGEAVSFNATTSDDDNDIVSVEWDFENDGNIDDAGQNVQHVYSNAGTRTVRMVVTDATSETAVALHSIRVNAAPSASFDFSPSSPAVNESVSFDASSSTDDAALSDNGFEWDLDNDGQYDDATGRQVGHAFGSPGSKTVGLRVTDSDGATDSTSRNVIVAAANVAPQAAFDFAPSRPNPNQSVSFDASGSSDDAPLLPTAFAWDLDGDGQFDDALGETPTFSYASGSRTVSLRVTDVFGLSDTASHTVTVNSPPSAAFGFSPSSPVVGQTVSFDASGSSDDGSLPNSSFAWDFDNDGAFDDGTGEQIGHAFASAGPKTVRLRVTDGDGATNVATTTVTVIAPNTPPQPSFTFSPTRPNPSQAVVFSAAGSTDDKPIPAGGYAWDFDNDGAFDDGTGQTAATSFATAGTKTVRLRVTDSDGVSATTSRTLTVNALPDAVFDFAPTSPEVGQTVGFDASDSTDDNSLPGSAYAWDLDNDGAFDDGTGVQIGHVFTSAGPKTVRLRVTDSDGATDVATASLTVSPANTPPQPSFTSSLTRPNIGQSVTFNAAGSTDDEPIPANGYAWDLDNDGQYDDATGQIVSASFASAGNKTVGLRVTDADGVAATTSRSLTVNAPPSAAFGFSPTNPDVGDAVAFDATASTDDLALPTTAYAWDLDNDGAFDDAVGQTISASFATSGSKTVRLQVTDSGGVAAVASQTVSVAANPAPTAAFTFTPARPNPAQAVVFNAATSTDDEPIPATGYAWDFDNDGAFDDGTGQTAASTFATSGAKTVRLRVTDGDGATGTVTATVTVNAAPTVDFTFTPTAPLIGQQVSLTATASDDLALPAGAYSWDLNNDGVYGDGGFTGPTATTTFTSAGAKPVKVRVTDSGTLATIVTKNVTVNRPPVADFSLAPLTPRLNEEVTFTSTSTDPDGNATISAYAWDLDNDGAFDDGTTATVKRAYTAEGDHTVRLRVTDTGGATSVRSRTFPVQELLPSAAFTSSPAHPVPGQQVTFTSTSAPSAGGQITKLEWDFNADSVNDAVGPVATTVYPTAGPRTVTLKVTDTQGFDIATAQIAVNAPPIAAFRAAPGQPYVGDEVDFASVSGDPDGPLSSEAWDLDGDGQYDDAAGKLASRRFTTIGVHTVRLRAADAFGASDVETLALNVRARPVAPPPELLKLDPSVHISSRRSKTTTLIRILSVRAPRGALVKARCYGTGCPKRRASRTRSKGKLVRLRWLERHLAPGTRVVISVTRSGWIGSYTSLVIRRSKLPARSDLCLMPSAKKPSRCSS